MKYSILTPPGSQPVFQNLKDVTIHDLGFDALCKKISAKEPEQRLILRILSRMTAEPHTAQYRCDVFEDIYHNKQMRGELMDILEKINFLREYGSFKREYDESAGAWDLLHRLGELRDYIDCVEALQKCLENADVKSEGLTGLRDYVEQVFRDHGFAELKKDIESLRANTKNLKSITVGINLNDRFEADGIGVISINDKPFTTAGIISNLAARISAKDRIKEGTDWDGTYKFEEFTAAAEVMDAKLDQMQRLKMVQAQPLIGIAGVPHGDTTQDMTRYMDRVVNHMISQSVKRIRTVLNRYVSITITDMTDLIPEFAYYVRFAEYIEKLEAGGAKFCKPCVLTDETAIANREMKARGIYNLKLAAFSEGETSLSGGHSSPVNESQPGKQPAAGKLSPEENKRLSEKIITNDLDFNPENLVYILTGANRGGKTTITQAIGQLFVLAQGGIFVPGDSFSFVPADAIFTHFPADEDKTMDLGRLGEECKRFREIYQAAGPSSLILLNETFSTTSFEEGYYIARDSVRALLVKGSRTIYNTHMHKLAFDIEEMNESAPAGKARSLIVKAEEGRRSYKVEVAPPVGQSFAKDIAEKYGVTYEMLLETEG